MRYGMKIVVGNSRDTTHRAMWVGSEERVSVSGNWGEIMVPPLIIRCHWEASSCEAEQIWRHHL